MSAPVLCSVAEAAQRVGIAEAELRRLLVWASVVHVKGFEIVGPRTGQALTNMLTRRVGGLAHG